MDSVSGVGGVGGLGGLGSVGRLGGLGGLVRLDGMIPGDVLPSSCLCTSR